MSDIYNLLKRSPKSTKEQIKFLIKKYNVSTVEDLKGSIIFGTGKLGIKLFNKFRELGVDIYAFADNDKSKWGKQIEDKPILPPSEIKKYQFKNIIIASKYVWEIYEQLSLMEFENIIPHYILSIIFPKHFPNPLYNFDTLDLIIEEKEKIRTVYELLADEKSKSLFLQILQFRITLSPQDLPKPEGEEYYPGDFWKLSDEETYADVGAYNGDTLKKFLDYKNGKFSKYICIEPDKLNYKKLKNSIPIKYKHKIVTINACAGDRLGKVSFLSTGAEDSLVSMKGKDEIKVISLDSLVKKYKFTTIKIDVEGYELEVLKGAREILKTFKPKVAVCVYHLPFHLWRVPLQIIKYNVNYLLYMRHHEPEIYETVLYAI